MIKELEKIALKPDEKLLITLKEDASIEQIKDVQECVTKWLGPDHNKVLICVAGLILKMEAVKL